MTAETVDRPRAPLSPAKRQRTRVLLALATAALAIGIAVQALAGDGLWTTGLIGWIAILVAVGFGAGTDNAAGIVGLGTLTARLRQRAAEADQPRNDADWS